MKKIIFFVVVLLLHSLNVHSQSSWFWQNPIPTASNLFDVQMIDNNTFYMCGNGGTIIKTTNAGQNWILQESYTEETLFALYFVNVNTGWAVGSDDKGIIRKTTDGGNTWFAQTSPQLYALRDVVFLNSNTGYIAAQNKILKTTNSGANWLEQSTPSSVIYFSVYFVNENTGWASGQTGTLIRTTNGGANWESQASGHNKHIWSVYMIDANNGYAAGESGYILKTTNGGTNWFSLSAPGNTRLFAISLVSATSLYCVGDSGTIIFSSNGGSSWVNQSFGTSATLRDVVFKNSNLGFIAGKNGVILTTTNGGTNWINRSFNTVNFYGIDFASIDTGYICGRGRIYKTINGGINWTQQTTPVPDSVNIKDIFCITSNNVWAVPWSGQIIYTTNGGNTKVNQIFSEVPVKYLLNQNYPNPFNPSTKIQFAIPKYGLVRLTVFDITGKTMAVLVNETMQPGTFEVEWEASHRASGVYFYKLETNDFSEVRKMILIK